MQPTPCPFSLHAGDPLYFRTTFDAIDFLLFYPLSKILLQYSWLQLRLVILVYLCKFEFLALLIIYCSVSAATVFFVQSKECNSLLRCQLSFILLDLYCLSR